MDEGAYLATLEFTDSETAEVEREYLVSLQHQEVVLVEQGCQGPPGPPGEGAAAWQQKDW
jgi:hypothetical protein